MKPGNSIFALCCGVTSARKTTFLSKPCQANSMVIRRKNGTNSKRLGCAGPDRNSGQEIRRLRRFHRLELESEWVLKRYPHCAEVLNPRNLCNLRMKPWDFEFH